MSMIEGTCSETRGYPSSIPDQAIDRERSEAQKQEQATGDKGVITSASSTDTTLNLAESLKGIHVDEMV